MVRNEHSWLDTHANRLLGDAANVTFPASRFASEPRTGQAISFRLADIYAPSLPELFKHITPGLELQGRIVLLSDGGESRAAFCPRRSARHPSAVDRPGLLPRNRGRSHAG